MTGTRLLAHDLQEILADQLRTKRLLIATVAIEALALIVLAAALLR